VYPMLQHYMREHLRQSFDLKGWRARGR
jgi:hypothetical protein